MNQSVQIVLWAEVKYKFFQNGPNVFLPDPHTLLVSRRLDSYTHRPGDCCYNAYI